MLCHSINHIVKEGVDLVDPINGTRVNMGLNPNKNGPAAIESIQCLPKANPKIKAGSGPLRFKACPFGLKKTPGHFNKSPAVAEQPQDCRGLYRNNPSQQFCTKGRLVSCGQHTRPD